MRYPQFMPVFAAFGAASFCLITSCPAHAQKPAAAQTGSRIRIAKMPVSLVFPPGYKPMTTSAAPSDTPLFGGPKMGGFTPNISVVAQGNVGELKMDAATAKALGPVVVRGKPNYTFLSSGTTSAGGEAAMFLVITNNLKTVVAKSKQVYARHNNSVYIFTFTTTEAAYPKQVAAFDKTIASVKWQ